VASAQVTPQDSVEVSFFWFYRSDDLLAAMFAGPFEDERTTLHSSLAQFDGNTFEALSTPDRIENLCLGPIGNLFPSCPGSRREIRKLGDRISHLSSALPIGPPDG